jgi:hypothetical protein
MPVVGNNSISVVEREPKAEKPKLNYLLELEP